MQCVEHPVGGEPPAERRPDRRVVATGRIVGGEVGRVADGRFGGDPMTAVFVLAQQRKPWRGVGALTAG